MLARLLAEARAILGDVLVGLYLYGSLAAGDFDPGSSDIDFVVVTAGELPDVMIQALEAMHARLAAGGLPWAKKLEGSYIPIQQLPRYDPAYQRFPSVNEGRFFVSGHGSDWVIQRYTLRGHPVVLAGPSLRDLIDPIWPNDIRRAVLGILDEWWTLLAADPERLSRDDYQAFAILSMCRALYALEHGAVVSKPVAARWARATLGARWDALIARAMAWRYGGRMDSLEPTREFIRYTLKRARTLEIPIELQ